MTSNNTPKRLPLLPGYAFSDPTKSKFHKSQCFDFKLGIPDAKTYVSGPGNCPRDVDSMQYFEYNTENVSLDPKLVYGRAKPQQVRPFRPHYVQYDRTCLRFQGYFQQPAFNTPDESYRVRVVDVLYFLEDDTVTVIEPQVKNSGLPQGRLVRRSRIPMSPPPDCEYLHWKDLNLGRDVRLCGFLIHLVDCDAFTREFLSSQGVEVNAPEPVPPDDFRRRQCQGMTLARPATANPEYKLRRFLQYDGIILKFRALWDADGDQSSYCISYFPADDTIQVAEIHEKNNGKDPFPILLKRTRLPKRWDKVELTYPSLSEEAALEVTEFYELRDLLVGKTVTVFGREMLIHQCDDFTRNYYSKTLNITQPDNFSVKPLPPQRQPRQLPPYTGFGQLEDSLQSCLTFAMKSPRKDIVRKIVNANHFLRYKAKLSSTHPEDSDREFVMSYSLADGTISILEPPRRNSGYMFGRFLSSMLVAKPGSSPDFPDYYTPQDFSIGSTIVVNVFRFVITGADLHVYNYMKDNLEKFRPEVFESVKEYVEATGLTPRPNADGSLKTEKTE